MKNMTKCMWGSFSLIWKYLSRRPFPPQSLMDLDASFYEMFWLIPCEALNVQAATRKHGQNPTVCLFSFDWNRTLGNVNVLLLGFRQWRIVRFFKSNILLYSRKTQRMSRPELPKELSQDVVSCSTLEFPVNPLHIQMTMQICRKLPLLKKSPVLQVFVDQ